MASLTSFSPGDLTRWARSQSLWFYSINTGCCGDEFLETVGCRYDLERFGCLPQADPKQADLLIVFGAVNKKSADHVKQVYEQMKDPKYVLAIGACACQGGPFSVSNYNVLPGISSTIPVDVFVPGCPPRPEAIMNGLITLQEKIRAHEISQ